MTKTEEYLTMTRIMNNELKKFVRSRQEAFEWQHMTGKEQLIAQASFRSGFMTGFHARFFGGNDD